MNNRKSFELAKNYFPGGVNSPVRAFKSVDSEPFIVARGEGAYLIDVEGKRYIDYINSWGPLVLGHAHPNVVQAIKSQVELGTSYGACASQEVELAKLVKQLYPSMELMRFVNSGTEAGMAVIRLARGFTGRSKILKFSGCYHGHTDSLLVAAGSGVATLGIPGSQGVSADVVRDTIIAEYNDTDAVEKVFKEYGKEIAAVIVEPVCGNAGFILPKQDFLKTLREVTLQTGSLLIFDEVMTGFRVALGGAQEYFKIKPDLTMLGKVIGGGLPVGAFGGKKEIMECLAPLGGVYQAGTLSGNPLAMVSGCATITEWVKPGTFEGVSKLTAKLVIGLKELAAEHKVAFQAENLGSMFGFFFNSNPVASFEDAKSSNSQYFMQFFKSALEQGVYIAPSQFEAGFVSLAHNLDIIEQSLKVFDQAFDSIKK